MNNPDFFYSLKKKNEKVTNCQRYTLNNILPFRFYRGTGSQVALQILQQMKQHILLVDDEEVSYYLIMQLIKRVGMTARIDSVTNGAQALSFINEHYLSHSSLPDLIFLDINMPVMDGFEFMNALHELNLPGKEKMEVIIVSSSMNPKDIMMAKAMGVKEYVSKPITQEFIRSVCL